MKNHRSLFPNKTDLPNIDGFFKIHKNNITLGNLLLDVLAVVLIDKIFLKYSKNINWK